MNTKLILASASICVVLSACGDTGTTSKATPYREGTRSKTEAGTLLIDPASSNQNYGTNQGFLEKFQIQTTNIPNPPAQYAEPGVNYPEYASGILPDGRKIEYWYQKDNDGYASIMLIDGLPVQETDSNFLHDNFVHVGLAHNSHYLIGDSYAYLGENGTPYAFYSINDKALLKSEVSANPNTQRTLYTVDYTYTAVDKNGDYVNFDSTRFGDVDDVMPHVYGTVTVNGDQWNAELGDVKLDGTIDGKDVSGKATGQFFGQTLEGEFAGIDGVVTTDLTQFVDPDEMDPDSFAYPATGVDERAITIGGFAGGNSGAVFSGNWAGTYESE